MAEPVLGTLTITNHAHTPKTAITDLGLVTVQNWICVKMDMKHGTPFDLEFKNGDGTTCEIDLMTIIANNTKHWEVTVRERPAPAPPHNSRYKKGKCRVNAAAIEVRHQLIATPCHSVQHPLHEN